MAEGMRYINLGNSGLKVSAVGYGNLTSGLGMLKGRKEDYDIGIEQSHFSVIEKCISMGVNFFDTSEIFGYHNSETYLGNNLKQGNWDRDDLIISTKFHPAGIVAGLQGNSRKRLRTAIHNSLKRLQLDNVDILYFNRFEDETPLKEQASIMNELIENDYAYYWGTSMYSAAAISELFKICEKYGFSPPIAEQCEYNLLSRKRTEVDLVPLFEQYGFGLTAALPLYGGMLSGKYNDGVPSNSRFGKNGWGLETSKEILKGLGIIAQELQCTQAQLALAWILKNKDVSNVLLGAHTLTQITENIGALDVVDRISPDVLQRIENIIQNRPSPPLNFRTFTPKDPRR